MSKQPPLKPRPEIGTRLTPEQLAEIEKQTVLPVLILTEGYLYDLTFHSELDEITLKESGITTKRATVSDAHTSKTFVLLNAHQAFDRELLKYLPLTGKTFQIINLGSVPIKGGVQKTYRYSIKPM